MSSVVEKVEQDVERHVLSLTVNLSDGTSGHVFTRNPNRNEANMYSYNCHMCSVPNLPGERCLYTHINGRKHQTKLQSRVFDADLFRAPMQRGNRIAMQVAPGEPVPPGFENEFKPVADIQATIDACNNMSLIGLEYLFELTRSDGREPSYFCVLCEKRGDPRTIMDHLTSFNHRLKYLEKHFPTVTRELVRLRANPDARDIFPTVIQAICEAIEDKYGRLTPCVYEEELYNKTRMKCLQEAINDKHLDEKMGSTFLHLIDHANIEAQIAVAKKKSGTSGKSADGGLDSISDISDSSLGRHSPSPTHRSRRSSDDDVIILETQTRPESRSQSQRQSNQIINESDRFKHQKLRFMLDSALKELEQVHKEHEKNPEKHPLYPEEWKKFWNRRYKELQAEKKDPTKHDFKPEWIQFWTKRMKELHDVAIEAKKTEIRNKIKAEESKDRTNDMKDVKIKVNLLSDRRTVSASRAGKGRSPSIEEARTASTASSSRRDRVPEKRSRSRSRSRNLSRGHSHGISREQARNRTHSRSRSRSRDERRRMRDRSRERDRHSRRRLSHSSTSDEETERVQRRPRRGEYEEPYYDYAWPPASRPYGVPMARAYYPGEPMYRPPHPTYYGRELPYRRSLPPIEDSNDRPDDDDDSNEPLTVVSVLRLLTAVEELLGPSLGPKVIDLLAKALSLEKVKANSADDLLLNEDNCVLFETIKEKLKGQLIADVVEKHQVKAVKKAIKNIAAVIHMVNEREKNKTPEEKQRDQQAKQIQESAEKSTTADVNSTTHTSAVVDKSEIAKKLAAALVAQGKTDITPDQLESLIHVYSEMERKKREIAEAPAQPSSLKPKEELTSHVSPDENAEPKKNVNDDFDLPEDASSALESLTDSDLQTLLQNFKDLSTEEQNHLVAYLKKLQSVDPKRVDNLRKLANIDDVIGPIVGKSDKSSESKRNQSSKKSFDDMFYDDTENDRQQKKNMEKDDGKKVMNLIDSDDDDDDDYSYDDVFKAASKNVKENETKRQVDDVNFFDITSDTEAKPKGKSNEVSQPTAHFNKTLADTQSIIANLMGSLQKKVQRNYGDRSGTTTNQSNQMANDPSARSGIQSNMPFYQQQQLMNENSRSNAMPSTSTQNNYANAAQSFLQNFMPTLNQNVANNGYNQMSMYGGNQHPSQMQMSSNALFNSMQQQPQPQSQNQPQQQYPYPTNNQFNPNFY